MFTRFAAVYDRLMSDFDYPAWAGYYLAILARAGVAPETVCECACGTGSMALELAARGLRVTGVDSSAEMLEQASIKARAAGLALPLVQQDMRALQLHRPADAILCPCDGVNYLLTEADLLAFFRAARANLRPGGALAFDFSTREKLEDQARAAFFGEDLDDLTYLWRNEWDEKARAVRMELNFFIRRPDGLYARFDERQTQRAHEIGEVCRALELAGFARIARYGDRVFEPPAPGALRVHIAAVAAE